MRTLDEQWAEIADAMGGAHSRDVWATRHEKVRAARDFTLSNGISPMTRGWPNAPTIPLRGRDGYTHMVTQNMIAILGQCTIAITLGTTVTMGQIADKVGVCVATVRRSVHRLASWGLIGLATYRGHGGGMLLLDPSGWPRWRDAARFWWEKLRAQWLRKQARSNVTSRGNQGTYTPTQVRNSIDVTFEAQRRLEAYRERLASTLGFDPSRSSGRVPCPAHGEHRSKTLSWRRANDGGLMYHCFAGCTPQEIRTAVGF